MSSSTQERSRPRFDDPDRPPPSPTRRLRRSRRYPTGNPRPGHLHTARGRHADAAEAEQHRRVRHLVTGATGYVGGRLAPRLLAEGDAVRCLVRDPAKLREVPWARDAEVVRGDLLDEDAVRAACADVDVVYFLVHSLVERDFAAIDRRAATIVARAARDAGVRRIVYLGGLHPDGPLSEHLESRGEVGEILLSQRRADRGAPGRRRPRIRLGQLRDAPLPHRAAARDGHAALGATPGSSRSPSATCCATSSPPPALPAESTGPSTSAAPRCSPTAR